MPTYTRCIQPQSVDPKLFANREPDEYPHIKNILRSIILAKNEEERRLLIHGERGIGKSIFLRKVLYDLRQEIDFILVLIDGKNSKNAEELLRDICENLASQLRNESKFKKDKWVIREIGYLDEISRVNTKTIGWAKSITAEIEGKGGLEIGLYSFFKIQLGLGSTVGTEKESSETNTIEINSRFLRQLLNDVIKKISSEHKKEVIIAIDNLDQIHDKEQIGEFIREIFRNKETPIIASLRNEAITSEFRRSFRDPILIKGLSQQGLIDVLNKRLVQCPEKSLLEDKLSPIAQKLSTVTDNPLSFLTWIHYLCRDTDLVIDNLVKDLEDFVSIHYNFDHQKAFSISKFFLEKGNPFLLEGEIKEFLRESNSEDDYKIMVESGILIPDDLYEQRKYRLSPDLEFFKLAL